MSSTTGSVLFPFVEMMKDTIEKHGTYWAHAYYSKRLPPFEFTFFWERAISA